MCLLSAKHAYSPKAMESSPHFGQGLAIFHDVSPVPRSLVNGERARVLPSRISFLSERSLF